MARLLFTLLRLLSALGPAAIVLFAGTTGLLQGRLYQVSAFLQNYIFGNTLELSGTPKKYLHISVKKRMGFLIYGIVAIWLITIGSAE